MGRNLALVLTPILFWVVTRVVEAWRNSSPPEAAQARAAAPEAAGWLRKAQLLWRDNPSPVAADPARSGTKPQVPGGLTPVDLTRGEEKPISPVSRSASRAATRRATRGEIAAWMHERADSDRPVELVKAAAREHGVSYATAKRAWAAVRHIRPGGTP